MKIKEIRIGNILGYKNSIAIVTGLKLVHGIESISINNSDKPLDDPENLVPVDLDLTVVEQYFDFKMEMYGYHDGSGNRQKPVWNFKRLTISHSDWGDKKPVGNEWYFYQENLDNRGYGCRKDINYIHQLQNLALTEEVELLFKPEKTEINLYLKESLKKTKK